MKLSKTLLILTFISASVFANDTRYKEGDCIMAVNSDWTWFREYVMVQHIVKVNGYGDNWLYLLTFPNRRGKDVWGIFSPSQIDESNNTIKVKSSFCKQ